MRLRSIALALLVLTFAAPSSAEPTKAEIAAARKLFDDAQADEAEGRWVEALEKLRRILAVKETAGVRFHAAVSEERLGQLLAAEGDYKRSAELAEKMPSAEGRDIEKRCAEALARLAPRLPVLVLKPGTGAQGARVLLDGAPIDPARLGSPIKHDPGEARVEASAPGRKPFSRAVVLPEGSNVTVDLSLEPEAKAEAPEPPRPEAPKAPPPAATGAPAAAWATGGLAVAGLGAGAYFTYSALRLRKETDDLRADPEYESVDPRRDTRVRQYWLGAGIGGAVLIGAGAATAYLVLSSGKNSQTEVGAGPGFVSVRGRF